MQAGFLVVFLSQRFPEDKGYSDMADLLEKEVQQIPGFLRLESVRDAQGRGITLSYWQDVSGILEWKKQQNHLRAKSRAKDWYSSYEIQIYEARAWNPS